MTTEFVSLGSRIRKDIGGTADVVGQKDRFNVKTTTTGGVYGITDEYISFITSYHKDGPFGRA